MFVTDVNHEPLFNKSLYHMVGYWQSDKVEPLGLRGIAVWCIFRDNIKNNPKFIGARAFRFISVPG